MFRTLNLFLFLSVFSLDLWAQDCQIYLSITDTNPEFETTSKSQAYSEISLPERFRPQLKIPLSKEAEALRNYIINQSEKLDVITLDLISKWLSLNSVRHVKEDTFIVVLPGEESSLNRFAKKIASFQEKYSENHSALPTKLVFDPVRLRKNKSYGFFEFYNTPEPHDRTKFSQEIQSDIGLSVEALIHLQPTLTEHHEMVHWARYYKRLKGQFSSIVNGHVINKSGYFQKYLSDQSVDFSLEEFEAHLLTLSILLDQQTLNPSLEEQNYLNFNILKDIDSLDRYALKTKKVLNIVLSKSQLFNDIGRVTSPYEILWKLDRNKISSSNSAGTETLSLEQVPGGGSLTKHIKYNFVSNDLTINLEFRIPLPQSLDSIEDLLSRDFRTQYHHVVRIINLRTRFLIKLIKYIENLKTEWTSNKKLIVSPKVYLHRLEEAYLYQVK